MSQASDCIPQFISAMEAVGVVPLEPIAQGLASGELIRFQCEGDGNGKRNGWAILHTDGRPAGAFGNYRLNISEKWKAAGIVQRLTAKERRERAAAFRAEKRKREAARLAENEAAADRCSDRWDRAAPPNSAHGYLTRKNLTGEGIRQEGSRLLIPMRDVAGKLWNVQAIDADGVKRFAKGGRQQGLFLLLGEPDAIVVIAEGYGTGAVVRRATGHAVAVAFSGANLKATALSMRERYPDLDIVIAADDDPHLISNPHIQKNKGLADALAAAQAVGGRVAIPPRKDISV